MTGSTTTQAGGRNSASLASYFEIARRLGYRYCADGSDSKHQLGYVEHGEFLGCIHWMERRVTKRGLRRFLKLAALLSKPRETLEGERWARLYQQNIEADRLGRMLGVRFPRDLADQDRAKVRYWLSLQIDRTPPEYRRVQRWARP